MEHGAQSTPLHQVEKFGKLWSQFLLDLLHVWAKISGAPEDAARVMESPHRNYITLLFPLLVQDDAHLTSVIRGFLLFTCCYVAAFSLI